MKYSIEKRKIIGKSFKVRKQAAFGNNRYNIVLYCNLYVFTYP
jgi:hypothetical protein